MSSQDTYPNRVHRHISTQMICLQHISWGIRRSSLPHQGVHAQQRCNILPQLLLYLSPTRPLHTELGHIFSEEIRESAHISREAIGNTTLCCSVVCCGCQWLRIFKETCRDFLGALHRDGHHITRFPIRESCTCRQTVLKKSVKWILTDMFLRVWCYNRFHTDLAVSAEPLRVDVAELLVWGRVTSGEGTPGTAHCTLPPSHQLTDPQLVNTGQYTEQYSKLI